MEVWGTPEEIKRMGGRGASRKASSHLDNRLNAIDDRQHDHVGPTKSRGR